MQKNKSQSAFKIGDCPDKLIYGRAHCSYEWASADGTLHASSSLLGWARPRAVDAGWGTPSPLCRNHQDHTFPDPALPFHNNKTFNKKVG